MLIIADSSALLGLADCQGLNFLLELFGDVKVPQAVYDEVAPGSCPAKKEALFPSKNASFSFCPVYGAGVVAVAGAEVSLGKAVSVAVAVTVSVGGLAVFP